MSWTAALKLPLVPVGIEQGDEINRGASGRCEAEPYRDAEGGDMSALSGSLERAGSNTGISSIIFDEIDICVTFIVVYVVHNLTAVMARTNEGEMLFCDGECGADRG